MSLKEKVKTFAINARTMSLVLPFLSKEIKRKTNEELIRCFLEREHFNKFSKNLYAKAPEAIQIRISYKKFTDILLNARTEIIKSKKFKKKVIEIKKKNKLVEDF